ncbi:hypothetical protein TNCV_4774181 [Trichonephila clavipes]|nr:hypothetical protein TNCV_4774181 [Trichonephila clavipes]
MEWFEFVEFPTFVSGFREDETGTGLSLVRGYDGRYTESLYPFSNEAFCHGFSGDITDRNDLRPSGVAINACQQKGEAIRWWEWSK